MIVKELIEKLKEFDGNMEILFSSDEEMNCLRSGGEVAKLDGNNQCVIYGFDGSEVEL